MTNLNNIDPIKLKIISEIKSKGKNMSANDMLPQIMKINSELQKRNMAFTKEESKLILDSLEENLSPSEKDKFKMIRSFMS